MPAIKKPAAKKVAAKKSTKLGRVKIDPRLSTAIAIAKTKATPADTRPVAVVDFETYYDEVCSVTTLGVNAYARHPQFKAYLVAIYSGPDGISYVGPPEKAPWSKLKGHQVVAHNAGFDWTIFDVLREQGKIKAPDLGVWRDTAALAAFLGAPRDLAGASKHLLDREMSKGMRNWMKGRTWEDAVREGKKAELTEYALGDSKNAWQLYMDYADMMPADEWRLSEWTVASGMHGIGLDTKMLRASTSKLNKRLAEIEKLIPWMREDDGKPTSPKQLAMACREAGIPPPKSTAKTSEDFELWLAEYSDKAPFVNAVREWRTVNRVQQVLASINRRAVGEVLTFSKKFYGAHTGRFSGDGGLNMENFPREDVCDVSLRGHLVARPGKALVVADFAQIEARISLWYAKDKKTLALVEAGMSVYEAHARSTMGWQGGKLKDEDDRLYRLAKARVLALGFGCWADRFMHAAKTMAGLVISKDEALRTVKAYRNTNKGITVVWDRLDAEAKARANPTLNPSGAWMLELPSGRCLRYFNMCLKRGPQKMQTFAQTVMGGPLKSIYGGLLFENMVQATARDVLRDAVLRLIDAGYQALLTVHDEVVIEVDKAEPLDKIKKLLCISPAWLDGCPMDVEIEKSQRYS